MGLRVFFGPYQYYFLLKQKYDQNTHTKKKTLTNFCGHIYNSGQVQEAGKFHNLGTELVNFGGGSVFWGQVEKRGAPEVWRSRGSVSLPLLPHSVV